MQIEIPFDLIAIFALIISGINTILILFSWDISREKAKPVLKIEMARTPPYKEKSPQTTNIMIINDGGRAALIEEILIEMTPTFDHQIQVILTDVVILPNGRYSTSVKLPTPDEDYRIAIIVIYRYGIRKRIRDNAYSSLTKVLQED